MDRAGGPTNFQPWRRSATDPLMRLLRSISTARGGLPSGRRLRRLPLHKLLPIRIFHRSGSLQARPKVALE